MIPKAWTVYWKNGNMLPVLVHDELTLRVLLQTGGVGFVLSYSQEYQRPLWQDEEYLIEALGIYADEPDEL